MLGEWEKARHGWQRQTIAVCCPVNAGRGEDMQGGNSVWKSKNTLCFPVFFHSGLWQVHCSRDLACHHWQSELLAPAKSSTPTLTHLFSFTQAFFFNAEVFHASKCHVLHVTERNCISAAYVSFNFLVNLWLNVVRIIWAMSSLSFAWLKFDFCTLWFETFLWVGVINASAGNSEMAVMPIVCWSGWNDHITTSLLQSAFHFYPFYFRYDTSNTCKLSLLAALWKRLTACLLLFVYSHDATLHYLHFTNSATAVHI